MSLDFYLHNTLKGKKEKLSPQIEGEVAIYLCGPTVYDFLHIGNFRGPITFNLLRNWLEDQGQKVIFVYNYTDVDDKIIKKAIAENVESTEISEKYILEFEKDFKRLGLKAHEFNPKVTDYIDEIIVFIQDLINKKVAYEAQGEVFYSIDSFADYGKLSKKKLDELEAGNRVEVDLKKHNPFDFVLWKPSKKGEPSWDSPWGAGRPGWHIECSAMIQSIFKDRTLDIHGGGIDLIFPHHENEIAQGEGRTGKCYCNNWMHNNFINMKDQKMSKSLGNIISAREFMDTYHPEVLKYLFLSVHYRSVLTVGEEKIVQVLAALDRIYLAILDAKSFDSQEEATSDFVMYLSEVDSKISKSLNDDLNSSGYISNIFEAVRNFNGQKLKVKRKNAHRFLEWISKKGKLGALFQEEPKQMLERLDEIMMSILKIQRQDVEKLIELRNQARDQKDWSRSDELRDQLLALKIEIYDGSQRNWGVQKLL
jgi:cysteinyl-tRNA synthetase